MQSVTTVLGASYNIWTFTGKVVGANKNLETQVGGGGSYQQGYSSPVTSTTYTHDNIFVQDSSGEEKALQLVDWDIACRDGHDVTVVALTKEGHGPYVCFHNRTTGMTYWCPEKLWNSINDAPVWMYVVGVFLLPCLGLFIIGVSEILPLAVALFFWRRRVNKTKKQNKSIIEAYLKTV